MYDWTITLSSAVPTVTVGFLRLFRSVTQAVVVVPVSMDELTVAVVPPAVSEKPSTVRKTNALPLWPEPPSQAPRRVAMARTVTLWRTRADQRRRAAARDQGLAHGVAGAMSGRRMFG